MKKVLKWMWESHKSQYPRTTLDWILYWFLISLAVAWLIITYSR